MKTLTPEEFETLLLRSDPRFRGCTPECIRGFVAFGSKPGFVKSTLDDLIQRGLLDHYPCKPVIEAGGSASHFYTNERGKIAMTLYKLTQQLSDLKLDGDAK